MGPTISLVRAAPRGVAVTAYPVASSGPVPRALGLSRAALAEAGFEGKVGQTLMVPGSGGASVAVGIGDPQQLSADTLRTAAAGVIRAAGARESVATSLADLGGVDAAAAGAAIAEGLILAGYRFDRYKSTPKPAGPGSVSLIVGQARQAGVQRGVQRGQVLAAATAMARDLGNTPGADLGARALAERAVAVAAESGLEVEVFNKDQLAAMGCGGIVGVNRGSLEPPRLVKLSYRPSKPRGHLALVGKGITFDSGGLSLKPSDSMVTMKLDMSGAAAVLAAMSTLRALRCPVSVTGFLVCTDNMSGGGAMQMGDVLRFRNGKTAEIHNTDAEGRLVLADGLSLAVELAPDAIVDIATLTGACMVALGTKVAGVIGTDEALIGQLREVAGSTGESIWQLPLEPAYRKLLDSNIADMKNVGGPYGGAITAALFLKEFTGDLPWAHLDIAGPMHCDADDGWQTRGASGFGARLLAELACQFKPPTR